MVIMTDEQNFRTLSLYGNPMVKTPNLEALAEKGCLFQHAYTPYPVCVPSRVALFTGRYPHTNGSRSNGILLREEEMDMLTLLKDAGYKTGLSGKNHCFRKPGLDKFDYTYLVSHGGPLQESADPEVEGAKRFLVESQVMRKAFGAEVNPFPPEKLGTAITADHAIEFIEKYRDEPFFLWFSIADPHTPIQTSEPYASMYPPDKVPLPPQVQDELESKPVDQQIACRAFAADKVTEEQMRKVISIYYGMNTYIDAEVGRVLKRLSELGLEEDTIVIYTSDHGDYVCEHGMIRKSKALYDCLMRIPLIVAWPNHIKSGQVFSDFVSMIDIMPTLMEMLGMETPLGVQGRSFLPLMKGEPYESGEAIFAEHGLEGRFKKLEECTRFPEGPLTPDFSPSYKSGTGRIKAVRTQKWKLVYYPNGEGELYDMENDPWELTNLYGQSEYTDVIHELERKILNWTIESEDTRPPLYGRQVD